MIRYMGEKFGIAAITYVTEKFLSQEELTRIYETANLK